MHMDKHTIQKILSEMTEVEKAVTFTVYREIGYNSDVQIKRKKVLKALNRKNRASARTTLKRLVTAKILIERNTATYSFTALGRALVKELVSSKTTALIRSGFVSLQKGLFKGIKDLTPPFVSLPIASTDSLATFRAPSFL